MNYNTDIWDSSRARRFGLSLTLRAQSSLKKYCLALILGPWLNDTAFFIPFNYKGLLQKSQTLGHHLRDIFMIVDWLRPVQ